MLFEMLAGHHPVQPLTHRELIRTAAAFEESMPDLASEVTAVPVPTRPARSGVPAEGERAAVSASFVY
jgi:hypothetical protein